MKVRKDEAAMKKAAAGEHESMRARAFRQTTIVLALVASLSGCNKPKGVEEKESETADAFVERVNREMAEKGRELSSAGFTYATLSIRTPSF